MKQVILQAIQDGLPLILFGAIAYLLFRLLRRKNIDAKPSLIREGLWLLFVLYTLFLLSVTVIPHWRFVLTIQKHMMEVLPLAKNNDKKPSGIVLNAFSDPFVLEASIYDVFEKMKSRLPEETWQNSILNENDES